MHVLILGGDGYLGWPTAMYFSQKGYEVTIVDNYFRRKSCLDLDITPLYPLPTLVERATIWHQRTGREIKVVIGDLSDPVVMRSLFSGTVHYDWSVNHYFTGVPKAVVHYAEQPSAPFSLLNYAYANTTITNNLLVTNNLMFAVRDFSPQTHIIKLGTMGVYGTPNIDIEEGWLTVSHKGRQETFLYPRQASSLYHTTKIMDTDLLWFGVRMWNLRVTDLMQGPVYGINTEESAIDGRLATLFNYDEIFGTLIHRFVVQAVIGYPLTVYGEGGQTRGYINIRDTLQCIGLAEEIPAECGQLRIYNQIVETFSVLELAELIQHVGRKLQYDVRIDHIRNPRKEAEFHYYNPTCSGLKELGLKPHCLTEDQLENLFFLVEKYKGGIRKETIFRGVTW